MKSSQMLTINAKLKHAFNLIKIGKEKGVVFFLKGDKLNLKIPENLKFDSQLLDDIREHRDEIKVLLGDQEESVFQSNYKDTLTSNYRIPLSFSQERLWFIDQLEGSVQYHMPQVIRLTGVLDKVSLERSFGEIVNRHEVLRTVLRQDEGIGYQEVKGRDGWQLDEIDGRRYADDRLGLQSLIGDLVSMRFDLSADYMLRAHLIELDDQEHMLVIIGHHIALDGWSSAIFNRELRELYNALASGREAVLPELAVQYADYAIWQRQYLHGPMFSRELGYWESKLSGVEPLELPLDYARPSVQSTAGSVTYFRVDPVLSRGLQELSQRTGSTLFMTLLSAFKVLLYRYSGQPDICVGSPIAGRTQHELEGLIGFFVNTLALRSDLGGNPSFTELLGQVKETLLEAYDHQMVPFEKVVETVVKERDLSRSPLFQVLFVLQNTPEAPAVEFGGLKLEYEGFEYGQSKFDLTFSLMERSGNLECSVEYCTELYRAETIERMLSHYQELLRSIVSDPGMGIEGLNILTAAEEHQLLSEFNGTEAAYPSERTLVDLFVGQAAISRDSVAVVFEGSSLTYGELDDRSNQLGHYLRGLGVRPESLVPICVERSLEMIVGILGILKAGGAYVPVDPSYPEDRIRYMLDDTGAGLVVSTSLSRSSLSERPGLRVIELDGDWDRIGSERADLPSAGLLPDNLAYVIYTSGSTGRPKGVMVEHRSVVNLIGWHVDNFEVNSLSHATSMASISFDAFGWEIWPYLSVGAAIFILDVAKGILPSELINFCLINKITHSFMFTPLIPDIVNELKNKKTTLKFLLTGGDQLKTVDINNLQCTLVNNYGPTENTVVTLSYDLVNSDFKTPPIGKPIGNVRSYIVDVKGGLQPVGVAGEICIGGIQVSRGYLNRADLTSEKFIRDIYGGGEGRLYRTGDLGRWLPDGNIEFLGRIDDQVKIRGYRIELGEIESVLQQSGLVRQAVVVARDDERGNKRLVGYVVPEGSFDREGMMGYLQGQLPEYMIPALWLSMESIPLTSNGKVDKRKLPAVDAGDLLSGQYVAPRNQTESVLAEIWQDLLGVDRVGIHDNFFELGGDSIITIQVTSRSKRAGYDIRPKDIFLHQSISGISGMLGSRQGVSQVLSEQGYLSGECGLLPIQQWFLEKGGDGQSHYNQSMLLGIDKAIEEQTLSVVLNELVKRHDVLRFGYRHGADGWHQSYGEKEYKLDVLELEDVQEEELSSSIGSYAASCQSGLDIEQGDLLRMVYIKTPESSSQNRLLFVIHHLSVDGVSWRVLQDDMEFLLDGLSTGEVKSLGYKSSSYRDWYQGLERYGQSRRLLSQSGYWDRICKLYSALPVDKVCSEAVRLEDFGGYQIKLSREQTKLLLQEVPRVYHTEINDILLSALGLTLSKWSGRRSIQIGLEGHGREESIVKEIDLSRTVGWFTSLYPVSLDIDQGSMNDVIKGVKEQLRGIPDKGLGYGVLRYINKEASLNGVQPWDIVFNYLGQFDNVVNLSKWFGGASESTGSDASGGHIMTEKLTVNSQVSSGELQIHWGYSTKHYNRDTILGLGDSYIKELQALISHCITAGDSGERVTPSDYGLGAEISYQELDRFLQEDHGGLMQGALPESIYRLSGLQQGMLFHGLYDSEAKAYIEQFVCDLKKVDVGILSRSWDELFRRHSILRSCFYYDVFSIPVQCVYKDVRIKIEELDYRGMDEASQASALAIYQEADRNKGFDFSQAPLMRISLIRLSDDHHRMLWTSHHMLFDGWSLQVLMGELLELYETLQGGKDPQPFEEDRYEDYIRYIERQDKEEEESYWRSYMSGLDRTVLLPFVQNSSDRTKGIGEYRDHGIRLDKVEAARINSYAQRNQLTLNTVMQGVWSYLLYRYTGQRHITYGVTVSGRPEDLAGMESRIGMYINTLPLHAELQEDQGIAGWLQQIQSGQVQSRHYQYSRLSDIQQWLNIQGDLFDSLLVFENYPVNEVIGSREWSLRIEGAHLHEQTNYPLGITISGSNVIDIWFNYNSRILSEEYVKEISGHFRHVLHQIVEHDSALIGDLNILTAAEEHQLLSEFNGTEAAYPSERTLVDLFVGQAAISRDSVAVVFEGSSLTYGELDDRSNQLGHYLRGLGVRPESLVPICVERSLEMIVGILGILKAGGAYVPVDPSYPEDRIRYMLDDTGADLVVSTSLSRSSLSERPGLRVIELDGDWDRIGSERADLPSAGLLPDNLAYVIYTSGSTGRPKGVMVEHRNACAFLYWCMQEFESRLFAVTFGVTSYCFDLSVFEIFYTLSIGKRLRLLNSGLDINLYLYTDENILINTVPSVMHGLLEQSADLSNVRMINLAGEPIPEYVKSQLDYKRIQVRNLYGPSEDTTYSTSYLLKESQSNIIPIGKPIANTQLYIAGTGGGLQPVGVPGEIYLGGAGVSRGYLNRADLTSEKFIRDIYGGGEGRLYRTGDLGRWLPDGNIEFLGRIDDQVKIRGYRIELGEIESVLQQSGLVRQAVVVARDDERGNKRLVGYVVPEGSFDREGMMGYLQGQLPEYMIPALWLSMESIPLTSNGKVDKRKLPAVDAGDLLSGQYVAPRNQTESVLAEIWQDLLGVDRVGIHDNFFELGGDSIITIQVTSRSKRAGYDIRPKDIFLHQSISGISGMLGSRQGVSQVLSEQGYLSGECGLLPIQQWFLEKGGDGQSHYNQSMLLGIDKAIEEQTLSVVLNELVKRHDVLRFGYRHGADGWHQSYGEKEYKLDVLELEDVQEEELSSSIGSYAASCQSGLDIEQGDLLRMVYIKTPESSSQNRLLFVIHHLSVDGVSWRVLQDDMEFLLDGLSTGEVKSLGYKSSSYRDWYQGLERYGQSRRLLSQSGYWDRICKLYSALPVDKVCSEAVRLEDFGGYQIKLSREQTKLLLQEVPRVYHTEINDILLSALGLTLSKWSGRRSIQIGLEGHGREESIVKEIDLSRTVGWFTSLYPVSLDIDQGSMNDVIKGVKEQLRGIPDKGLGYGVLRYINKEASLNGVQPWDIVFNYLGQFDNVVNLSKWFGGASESTGSDASGGHIMTEKLTVNSQVSSGELQIHWGYSTKHYNRDTILGLGDSYIKELQALISHCITAGDSGERVTPSDYGLGAEISYQELDRFLQEDHGGLMQGALPESIYRLSGLQQGMLFHGLYDSEAKAYIEQFVCDLKKVDVGILSRSWDELFRRHSILRSCFYYDVFSIPVQCVYKDVRIKIEELDYRGMDEASQASALAIYQEADRNKGFDFSQAPLMRISLIRLSDDHHRMLWTSHHMLFDGWSLQVLMGELLELYETLQGGKDPQPFEEDRYEDYIRYIERQDKEEEESYWRSYMSGLDRTVLLPFVQNSSDRTKGIGEYRDHGIRLDKVEAARINSYAQRNQLTLNTVMQGVWSYLLYRYTGQRHITYGVTVSGRPEDLAGMESRIGMYINTLPLHAELQEDQGIAGWLQQIQSGQVQSRHYQYSRLSDIQQWLNIQGDLFDSLLVFENYPVNEVIGSREWSLRIEGAHLHEQTNYPLGITISGSNVIDIWFNYNSRILSEEYVKEISGHFRHVLHQIVEHDSALIGDLNILTAAEEHQLLSEFNGTEAAYPSERTLVDLFVGQAAISRDSVAVVFEGSSLTYGELDDRSNQLGHYLRGLGVRPESLVPICVERSLEMIVGILGILKAGGAYVPVDPSYPEDRIRYMLDDTGADLVVSTSLSRSSLSERPGLRVIELDGDWDRIGSERADLPSAGLLPDNLAYVIYTSGSTGRPKGVMVEHRSVVSLINSLTLLYNISEDERILLFSNYCFDASVEQIFLALFNGASLILFTEGLQLDTGSFESFLQKQGITHLHTTPGFLSGLEGKRYTGLKRVISGGELCRSELREHWRGQVDFYNEYGPTETTVTATEYHSDKTSGKSLPIGKPIGNVRSYIVDVKGGLQPVGVAGEICIGGIQVSRGYLNRADLTSEKFIRDIYGGGEGRLYRTGDLGRWLPDGNIEFLGRIDDQVKIRGYRIELGEIESVLQQSGLVRQAVVVARDDERGNKRLVGYVVPEGSFDREGMMGYLQGQLPEYMIPALWLSMESIPLTSNGKVDKRKLPAVDAGDLLSGQYVAPRNQTESVLAEIWQDLLGVDRVGIHDNFFELGGDSIITIQVTSRSKRAGYDIRPKDIFLHQSISGISGMLGSRQGVSQVLSEQGYLSGECGLLPIQQWFLEKGGDGQSHYNQSMLLGIDKAIEEQTLSVVLNELVKRHDVLRFGYRHGADGWHQSYGEKEYKLDVLELEDVQEEELSSSIGSYAASCQSGLDIEQGDLLRMVYIKTPESSSQNRLLFVIHHLSVDGVSWRVLQDDMEFLLDGLSTGEVKSLGYKSSSYRDWYQGLERYGQSRRLLSQSGYWDRICKLYSALPVDKVCSEAVRLEDFGGYQIKLSREQTKLLLQEVPRVYHTEINDILLSALGLTLSKWSGRRSIQIGLEGHGREESIVKEIDLSRTVGWFTSLYPVSLDIDQGSMNDVIKGVKEQLRGIPDKGLGYGVLRYINKEASLNGVQPWDIVFNYLGQFDNVVNLSKWFGGASESTGSDASGGHIMTEKLTVNSQVSSGELQIHWGYSTKHYNRDTILGLGDSYIKELQALISHCITAGDSGERVTPSDYGLGAEISYQELDRFLQEDHGGLMQGALPESIYRLSGLQQGMLFHGLYDSEAKAYIEQFVCDLKKVDVGILSRSWDELFRRHSILRSCFYYDVFSIPVQCVYKDVRIKIEELDYRGMDEASQASALAIYQEADRNKGFDFSQAPLMRISLIRLSDDHHRMLWTSHHMLFDGWSLQVLMGELLELYETLQGGKDPQPFEEDRYEDYIRYIERQDKEEEESYWRSYMSGLDRTVLLPFVQNSSDRTKGIGEYRDHGIRLDKVEAARINSYAQRNQLTLNTVMQGVWSYLLYRYTGQRHITYGVTVSGRPEDLAGMESRIGMYINTLPLHAELQEDQGIAGWLQQIQSGQVQSRHYQYSRLSDIQQWLNIQGDLFDSLLVFENYPVNEVIGSREWSLRIEGAHLHEQTNYPLGITISGSNVIDIWFNYNSRILSEEYVKEISGHFRHVLHQIVEHDSALTGDLNILTAAEEHQLLSEFNGTEAAYPSERTLVDLFVGQAAISRDSVAVVFEGSSLTYGELDDRSNQLGHYLRGLGVRPESLVPICVERSLEMIVGILGILKAGGAYVPVDPSYPEDRIRYMLDDTGADLVVSTSLSRSSLSERPGLRVIELDGDWDRIGSERADLPSAGLLPDNLAYVIYTSGSTGRPKGVMVEHRSVVSLINSLTLLYNISEDERILLFSNYCFDASVEQIFLALFNGASLILFTEGLQLDTGSFESFLQKQGITHLETTPGFLSGLEGKRYTGLKRVISGGELCRSELREHWRGQVDFYILYGPTETTVTATEYHSDKTSGKSIPIGKPVANTQLYIVGPDRLLQPVGVAGEICIGGIQVSRGYLNRADLTSEKFIRDIYGGGEGRLYRTGDLGRWLPDGNIEFLGRIDDQVKIRGYRIELGEIESVLQQSGLVRQAVVVARDDERGNKRLVGYVVPEGSFDREGMMGYLQGQLPEYMIPALWLSMESIPLTSNGKVDKRKLPAVDAGDLLSGQYVAPRNQTESVLAEIWQDLLGVDRVGIHDNFFELGGDSIITIQVTSRSKRAGYDIRPKDIFLHQSISGISGMLGSRQGVSQVLSEQGYLSGECGLLPIQQWFLEKGGDGQSHYNQSMLLGIDKAIEEQTLSVVLNELVKRHDVLRFGYRHGADGWHQSYGEKEYKLDVLELEDVQEEELSSSIGSYAASCQSGLDIEQGDLLRMVYIKTPESSSQNRLLFVIHHLSVDGVSWRVLQDDMEFLLDGLSTGEVKSLGYKSSSYRDWYQGLERYGQSRRLLSQSGYWDRICKLYSALPVDKVCSEAVRLEDFGGYQIKLSREQTKLLLQEVPRVYHTEINDILLSALGLTLSKWSGRRSIQIGLEGHGREESIVKEIDLSRTVGWFTSLYPVSLDIDQGSMNDVIKGVKEQLRGIPDKGLGYGVLRYINKEASLNGVQPWDIVFNYLGQFDNVVNLSKWFGGASESTGSDASGGHIMTEKLTVNSQVSSGELQIHWGYSTKHYNRDTILGLGDSYIKELQALISHCITAGDSGERVTPSDYGLGAEISYQELDRFLQEDHGGLMQGALPESIYRLSGLQQGMLFHGLYDSEAKAYIEQFVCDLKKVDVGILSRSWDELFRRHSILRSCFYYDVFSIPVQCVYKDVRIKIEELDYRGMDEASQASALAIYQEADRNKGFDFSQAPLMRISLIRLSDDHHRMLWTSHHMLFDGWSLQVLMGELLELYETLQGGKDPQPFEEDRYEDYIRYIERQDKEEEESYWRSYMSGLDRTVLLPFVQNSSDRTKGIGEYRDHGIRLDKVEAARINSYAQRNQLTLNTVMQGVWSYLLYRYTGQRHITYGVTVSGRPEDLAGMESRIGMYINTLPLHAELQEDQGIAGWLQQIQSGQVQSRHYQYSRLSDIQQWLNIQGDLFDSLLVFENYPVNEVIGSREWSLRIEGAHLHEQTNYPLGITISGSNVIDIWFNYNSRILSEEYVKEISGHFRHVLHQIVEHDSALTGDLNILTAAEEHQLLSEFNGTEAAYPSERTLVDLFVGQAAISRDSVAVVFEGSSLTYGELDDRSNQLGHYLRGLGVRPESLVPICVERSLEMIVGILGILKAGGAYVPVDPSYPEDRIRYMLDDTGADLVVSTSLSRSSLSERPGLRVIELDGDWDRIGSERADLPSAGLLPDNLAYVIYTSGSTGRPKGVMIEHRSAVNNSLQQIKGFEITSADKVFQFASLSFDASVSEIFTSLLSSAILVCSDKSRILDSDNFPLWMKNNGITIVTIPPAYLKTLPFEELLFLRALITAGEKADVEHLARFSLTGNSFNAYGPTEGTVCMSIYKVKQEDSVKDTLPIGKPMGNVRSYIVDVKGGLQPVGVAGEICIGGIQVSRGYLNRADLTSEKFIRDIYGGGEGRLYRTGDLGRWLPDGNIEFLGRIDDQVKIRGYRIELGEIESVLQQSGLVRQAVVVARDDERGNKRLVGYVVPEGSFDREGMMGYLQGQLPEYMIPALWLSMESIPLTSNGKVDKRKLPAVDAGDLLSGQYVAPRNQTESVLAEIWQDLLGVDRVGIHDNFFELGGDSIITIQVTSRSKRAGYDIRPKDIFLHQSISGISGMLGSRQGVSQVLSEQGYLSGECGLLPIQQWFLEKGGDGQSHYNQSMLLGIDKAIEEQTLSVVLNELVKRHDVLRFGYRHGADGWHQSYGEKEYKLDVLELEDVQEEELSSSIGSYAASCQSGLDIEQGDLLRMVYIKTPESSSQNRLLFVIHHLSVDGVSWRVLQDDMEFLLDGLSTGEVKSLGYKSSSYRDWYQGLERYGQSRRLLSQSGYWDRICKLYSALPVDKVCSEAVRLEDFGGYQIKLSREQTKLLLQEVPRVYHTEINDILLSALGLTLSKWSGRRSIQIGLEGHGREESIVKEIDLSRTVGWFTSLYPVSLDIDQGSMNDVIKGVKEQLRGIPDKGLGYGVLRYINKEASLNGVQPWDIVFNYLGQFDNVVNLSKWFGGASESTGSDASGGHIMTEKLTVNSQVSSGELQIHWGYSTKHYNRDTILGLGDSYIKELQALISHCITAGDSGERVTPSDYGLGAEISYQELDRFLQEEKKSKTDIMEF